jgi:hypothetical protein
MTLAADVLIIEFKMMYRIMWLQVAGDGQVLPGVPDKAPQRLGGVPVSVL